MSLRQLDDLGVTTTTGARFTGEEAAAMAWLVYKRFGFDREAATAAWRRLLGNSCPEDDFVELAQLGQYGEVLRGKARG